MARMLRAFLRHLLDRLGPRYPRVMIAVLFPLALVVVLAGVWLLDLDRRAWAGLSSGGSPRRRRLAARRDRGSRQRSPSGSLALRIPGCGGAHARDGGRRLARAGRPAARPHPLRVGCGAPGQRLPDLALRLSRDRRAPLPALARARGRRVVVLLYGVFLRFFGPSSRCARVEDDRRCDAARRHRPGQRTVPLSGGCSSPCRSINIDHRRRGRGSRDRQPEAAHARRRRARRHRRRVHDLPRALVLLLALDPRPIDAISSAGPRGSPPATSRPRPRRPAPTRPGLAGSFNQMVAGPAGARAPARGVRRVRRPGPRGPRDRRGRRRSRARRSR